MEYWPKGARICLNMSIHGSSSFALLYTISPVNTKRSELRDFIIFIPRFTASVFFKLPECISESCVILKPSKALGRVFKKKSLPTDFIMIFYSCYTKNKSRKNKSRKYKSKIDKNMITCWETGKSL